MKKVVNFVIMAIAIAGCHKDPIHPSSSGSPGSCTSDVDFSKAKVGNLRVWYDNGGTDYGCKGTGGNCLPDIIVTPSLTAVLNDVFDAIANDPRAIPALFEKNRKLLHDLFEMKLIQAVINGAAEIDDRVAADNPLHYLIFMSKPTGEIMSVYPLMIPDPPQKGRIWYDNGGTDFGCISISGICLPDIIISADLDPILNNVFAVLHSGNPQAIGNVIGKHRMELADIMDMRYIDGVLNGVYALEGRGKQNDETRFLLFSHIKTGELLAVYPIVN